MPLEEQIIGGIRLIRADCMDVLPELTGVDLVVTDPPYLVRAGAGGGCFGQSASLVQTGDFTDSGCDYSFLDKFKSWFCFCSKNQLVDLLTRATICDHHNLLVWCKTNPLPTCNNKYLPDLEFIVHGYADNRLFGDYKLKSSYIVWPCGQKETEHPNEKPLKVMHKLVRLGSMDGDVVLDPFMGSGTTLVACIQTGRKGIGIESERKWFDVACKRIEAAARQRGHQFTQKVKTGMFDG